MNRYPLWKYLILIVAISLGALYALPNLFGEDPTLQISTAEGDPPDQETQQSLLRFLEEQGVPAIGAETREGQYLIRFDSVDHQMDAADLVSAKLGRGYTAAMTLTPRTPAWLRALGAEPMYLGLDLRGGVHFLLEVDVNALREQTVERHVNDFRTLLRQGRIRYGQVEPYEDLAVRVSFREAPARDEALRLLQEDFGDLEFDRDEADGNYYLIARITQDDLDEIVQFSVNQNITTLRNRVDELGVAEPVIQRQGAERIVVQLPGVQDPARAKEILGATATLEFRLVDMERYPFTGDPEAPRLPPAAELFQERDGNYVVLQRDVMMTGDRIVHAASGIDQETGGPQVNIRLSGAAGRQFNRITREHVGDLMAVVFIERQSEMVLVNDEPQREVTEVREVISVANIREPLGASFRITGLDSTQEARNLALLLRAGALAAPIDIVEERTIGPSLGAENVRQGFLAVVIGFALVVVFMAFYYRVFGLVANLALITNLVLIVAVLSLLQATLTLPGIAGIVLTVGMAVDANVLIFQRIREELHAGSSIQRAIDQGYGKALSTIADANVTTLIAAVVLFVFGTGPVQGFAVTLSIGLVTSMFTAILGTRAVINLIYGGNKRVAELKI
ncbi:protein translocase subunit SecD [Alkalilimnicola ehrlichii MLHE-1]|uniref:Protein translocase subunit SecD n=1 Tax=Alkalilimnicola ehrlichii (strain ATCC BAA-1101 / DSM 17681 / MLHE-1) TaxID=187272 RepID=Q0A9C0_ALKEH|nr:protein translocase subunit SecD [Alkalilimnicola ehrlichii]ABI56567.1 protein-export membrane protein SecD [Alkalilimnicola ehrlichii MLHE-1]